MQYTDLINELIINRKLTLDQTCRKTWQSLASYKLSHEYNDVRWDYAYRLSKRWKGKPVEFYFDKMPEYIYVEVTGIKYYIDYGKHQNSIPFIYKDMFIKNPKLAYEYKMYHKPENDHCPIPKSKGGQFSFDNLECVPKYANVSSQDVDLDEIIEAYHLAIQTYTNIRNKLA